MVKHDIENHKDRGLLCYSVLSLTKINYSFWLKTIVSVKNNYSFPNNYSFDNSFHKNNYSCLKQHYSFP